MQFLETQYTLFTTKVARIETVRAEAERRAEVEMAMKKYERRILEKFIKFSAKLQARAEAMRVKGEMKVEAERRAAKQ